MELNKILDYAIAKDEMSKNASVTAGYKLDNSGYGNYLSNNSFADFVADMQQNNPVAYEMFGKGGGKELVIRKVGANIYPPKMASFGSSSRMIYNMMKDVDGFLFEKKLHTTIGGTANLDGFYETDDKYMFFEAKCREPYSAKDKTVADKYKKLYEFISKSGISLRCNVVRTVDKKMPVEFVVANTPVECFDMKQMICHLLGVATACLNGKYADKKIEFVYLLFNPNLIQINEGKDKICNIYSKTCDECNLVDFKALLGVIIDYLQNEESVGKMKNKNDILNRFSFSLCDQTLKL